MHGGCYMYIDLTTKGANFSFFLTDNLTTNNPNFAKL